LDGTAANCSIVEIQWIKLLRRCKRRKKVYKLKIFLSVVAEMLQW